MLSLLKTFPQRFFFTVVNATTKSKDGTLWADRK